MPMLPLTREFYQHPRVQADQRLCEILDIIAKAERGSLTAEVVVLYFGYLLGFTHNLLDEMDGRKPSVATAAMLDENVTRAVARLIYEQDTGHDWHNAEQDPGFDRRYRARAKRGR